MLELIRTCLLQKQSAKFAAIRLLVLDVDGVLTDGGLWFDQEGRLQKRFDVRDGLGIRLLQEAGLTIAFMSGGRGGATEVRARQLGIEHCLVGIKDKTETLENLQNTLGFTIKQTAVIGDDLNDLAVRSLVSLLITPRDACDPIRRQADWVLQSRGGDGAVREAAEALLKSRKKWNKLEKSGWRDRND